LPYQSRSHRRFDSIGWGPLLAGHIPRAKENVHDGQHGGVVLVDVLIVGVVPMVESGSGYQQAQPAKAPAQIGVNEEAPHGTDEKDEQGHHV